MSTPEEYAKNAQIVGMTPAEYAQLMKNLRRLRRADHYHVWINWCFVSMVVIGILVVLVQFVAPTVWYIIGVYILDILMLDFIALGIFYIRYLQLKRPL